jgi:hypothetical protein
MGEGRWNGNKKVNAKLPHKAVIVGSLTLAFYVKRGNDYGSSYFKRTVAVIRAEKLIWMAGSEELECCLREF